MVEISPQWPPASVPWATTTSTPMSSCRSACRGRRRGRRRARPARGPLHDVRGWRAERVDHHLDAGMRQGDLDLTGALGVDAEAGGLHDRGVEVLRARRDAGVVQDVPDEVAVLLRDHGGQRLDAGRLPAALADVSLRHREVHAVRPAADVVVDPVELDREPLRLVGEGSQHAEPPGVGDCRDHVAAVAEGEDRELDPEPSQIGVRTDPPVTGVAPPDAVGPRVIVPGYRSGARARNGGRACAPTRAGCHDGMAFHCPTGRSAHELQDVDEPESCA